MNTEEMKRVICKALSDKKGEDITVLDVRELTVLADYFIISSGKSAPQVRALAENVDEVLSKEYGIEPLHRDGVSEGRWIVMDYGSIIVHAFRDDTRMLYCLEKLWGNEKNIEKYTD